LFADVTVAAGRTASLERAHDIAEGVEREIARVAPGTDVVVHVEPTSETSSLVERVQAAASRSEGVHEVHNVLVHAFDDAGTNKLHVTLHAKAAPRLSVAQAHDLADRIEAQVVEELGLGVRVDAHIEPLEQTLYGKEVTAARPDIVTALESRATEEVEILDCHEVIVVETGESLTVIAHVRGRGDISLARLHDAADRVEKAMLAEHPAIGRVLIHFEPA
jgi:divalent metal cation (Fe/Co/Zn/Cd) transporter